MGKVVALRRNEEIQEVQEVQEEKKEVLDLKEVTVESLLLEARKINSMCNDYTIKKACSKNIRFNESAGITYIPTGGDIIQSQLSRFALSQLCTKLGIPTRYIDSCINSGRIDLAGDNINSWLSDYNKGLFIREYEGRVRGILSNKYSVCDSHEILETVGNAVDLSKYKVKGSFLDEERLHLRIVSTEMLPIDGEDLFAGLFINSSDVGRSILTVQFGIYKQVCTNGLVISKLGGTLFEQKHIGISAEEFNNGLVASLKNVDELTERAVDLVKVAKEKQVKVSNLSKEDFEDFIKSVKDTASVPTESANKVVQLMKDKYGETKWGYINSLTEVAQDFTLERRLNIEKVAGNILAS